MDKYKIMLIIILLPLILFFVTISFGQVTQNSVVKTTVPVGEQYHYISEIVVPNGIVDWAGTEHNNISSMEITANITAPIYYDRDNSSYYVDPSNSGISIKVAGEVQASTVSANTICLNGICRTSWPDTTTIYYYAENEVEQCDAYDNPVVTLTENLDTGTYLILASCELNLGSGVSPALGTTVSAKLYVDGTLYGESSLISGKDSQTYKAIAWSKVISLTSGIHTISINAWSSNPNSYLACIRRARITVIKLA